MSGGTIERRAGRPSAEESEQKRQNLILIALEEFARTGYHAASLREIAEKANLSSRTLYNYYPDKGALFEACLEYSGKQTQRELPDLDGDIHEKLVGYTTEMQRQLSFPLSLQITRLIYRDSGDFEELRRIARNEFERYQVTPVVNILRDSGIDEGLAKSYAMNFVAMAFGEWQRRMLFGGEVMTYEEMKAHAESVTTIFINGIGG